VRPIVILKTGDTLPGIDLARGDFDAWIVPGLGWPDEQVVVVEAHRGEPLPPAVDVAGTVVTGSPAMVTDHEPWSVRAGEWLAELVERGTPIFGICYGHQLLAEALGGEVGLNPRGREIGTVEVELFDHGDDALFGGLDARMPAHATHLETVLRLPEGARALARSALDDNHAFRVGACAWGVQFHPEFDADIMRRYIEARREPIVEEGLDADGIRAAVDETPTSAGLLTRFGELVRQRELARAGHHDDAARRRQRTSK
jgi:GMP synthase (glutamine-hydrolysing)